VDDEPGGTEILTTRFSEIPTVQSVRSSADALKLNPVPAVAHAAVPKGEPGHPPERALRPGRVGVGAQRAVDRVQLDQQRRVKFRPLAGPALGKERDDHT
jgi:hypothetical protein